MSMHEKMQQDYIWLRENPAADADPKARTHGQHYLFYHAPNKRERLEMTWRSLGKAYDWEMEKFRMAKKPVDRGNKRRFFKNMFRFVKHPIGYTYWKTFKLMQPKGRAIGTGLFFLFGSMLMKYKMTSYQNSKRSHYVLLSGKNVQGGQNNSIGYDDNRLGQPELMLSYLLYSPLMANQIVVSPSRNQNYRKYFEMKKKQQSSSSQ